MAEMKQELWLATDDNKESLTFLFAGEPELVDKGQFKGKTIGIVRDVARVPAPGHKARLTIGEAVDCRPKPVPENVPELWIERDGEGRTFIGDSRIDCCFCVPSHFGGAVPKEHVCRIAWDENGIRLIGTPERV